MRLFNRKILKKRQDQPATTKAQQDGYRTIDLSEQTQRMPKRFAASKSLIETMLETDDLVKREFDEQGYAYYYISTIIDQQRFDKEIVNKIARWAEDPTQWQHHYPQAKKHETVRDIIEGLLNGDVVLLHRDMSGQALSISIWEIKSRAVERPEVEKMILGPQESYTEDFETNIGLTRRWVKDVNMTFRYFEVGERSKTKVAVGYIRDITNPEWVREVEANIKKINIDRIISQKDLMDLIIGKTNTPFPLYELTELPARVCSNLSDGRIVILVEGTPLSINLPSPLLDMYRGNEYIYQGNLIPFFIRVIRLIASALALFSPAFYVALVSVNSAIIPTETGVVMATDQLGIPYPTIIEALLIFIVLDIFIEATSHVPGAIGPALNIVGSLIIGQAAAQANLASQVIIIVTAITAVGSYVTLYQLSLPIRIWKYPMIFGAAVFGLFGIVGVTVILLAHLCGLKTLGVPYLSPLAPMNWKDMLDGGIWDKDRSRMKKRPSIFKPQDVTRQEGEPDA